MIRRDWSQLRRIALELPDGLDAFDSNGEQYAPERDERTTATEHRGMRSYSAMHAGTHGERHPLEALPYTYLHTTKIPG